MFFCLVALGSDHCTGLSSDTIAAGMGKAVRSWLEFGHDSRWN